MFEGFKVVIYENISKLISPKPLATIVAVLLLVGIFIVISKKTSYNTRTLTYGALAISAAFILSFIKIVEFPNGGSITVASMLPIFVYAYIAGPRAGILAGLCYGMLQYFQEPYFVHWTQLLLDYPIAFALLGTAGLFKDRQWLGALVGSMARFLCHFLSGIVFFAEYAGEQNVFLYSFGYNISYILPDLIICMVILMLPSVKSAIKRLQNTSLHISKAV